MPSVSNKQSKATLAPELTLHLIIDLRLGLPYIFLTYSIHGMKEVDLGPVGL